jgi:hypothetical protein
MRTTWPIVTMFHSRQLDPPQAEARNELISCAMTAKIAIAEIGARGYQPRLPLLLC